MGSKQSVSGISQRLLIGDGCWEWQGRTDKCGYGGCSFMDVSITAHRAFYQLWHSVTLDGKTVVRHTCDNRKCCRPSHLVTGTQADNIADMVSRGRQHRPIGELNGRYCHGRRTKPSVCAGLG